MTRKTVSAALALALCLSSLAAAGELEAEPGERVRITLEAGDVLRGIVVHVSGETVVLDHDVLGRLEVPHRSIAAWDRETGVPGDPASELEKAASATRDDATESEEPDVVTPPLAGAPPIVSEPQPSRDPRAPWTGEVSVGATGSEGNSSGFSMSGGGKGAREGLHHRWRLEALGRRAEEQDVTTEAFARGGGRHDFLLPGSPWELFQSTDLEYDEFKDYDLRLSFAVGPTYRWLDDETWDLATRVGFGASREFGGVEDEFVPEVLLGLELAYAISEMQRFYLNGQVYPALDQLEFRSLVESGLELDLALGVPLALRLGIEDRYESETPEGVKENDVDYRASLVHIF